ncbi:VWA domain-containing protein [Cyanobium sp. To12R1]|nr:VWA domain-containing protein [Cyanobium sp. To12R1]
MTGRNGGGVDSYQIKFTQTLTDQDGDTSTAFIDLSDGRGSGSNIYTFNFNDDGPKAAEPTNTELSNDASSSVTQVLDLNISDNFGTDGAGHVAFAGIASGALATITSSSLPVYYFVSADGLTLTATTSSTNALVSDYVFTIVIGGVTSGQVDYTVTNFAPIDNGSGITYTSLGGINAGNPSFYIIGDNSSATAQPVEILATSVSANGSPGTVNNNSTDLAVDNNNINPDEVLRLDFGEFSVAAGSFAVDKHIDVNAVSFNLTQVPGNPGIPGASGSQNVQIKLTAYDADSDNVLSGDPGDVKDPVTLVQVYNGSTLVASAARAGGSVTTGGISFNFSDPNSVSIANLQETYSIRVFTDDGFSRLEIQSLSSGDAFSVSTLAIGSYNAGNPVTQSFNVNVVDGDGDTASSGFDVTWSPLVDPVFLVGSASDDRSGSTDSFFTSGGPGVIEGTIKSDVLIGDPGGSTLKAGSTANVVLVLDVSGSMGDQISFGGSLISRLSALKQSVNSTLDSLYNSGASDVRVHIDIFSTGASLVGTYVLTAGGVDSPSQLAAAKAAVNALSAEGWTNYEAGLQSALNWINSTGTSAPLANADVNRVLFVSDGDPNRAMAANSTDLNSASSFDEPNSIAHILGTYNPSGTSNDDTVSEVALIEAAGGANKFTIEAVGINVTAANLDRLSQVEGSGGSATNVTSAEQLNTVIGQLTGSQTVQTSAGADDLSGGAGADLIFGDAPFTDALALANGLTTPTGSGWLVFQLLEGTLGATAGPGGGQWSREDTLNYIRTNPSIVAQESARTGAADQINGGDGDDRIYGQEGNDIITGGKGVDQLSGGTGADQFVLVRGDGSASAATVEIDVITDFTVNTDTIIIDGNGTTISSVAVSAPSANVYTITVTYLGGSAEYFKVNLTNGAVLNDAPGGVASTVGISGVSATIDGTIVGATLFLDINHNNQEDVGERLGITDAKGHLEWVVDLSILDVNGDGQFTFGEARAVQSGGLDTDTGLTYEINLYGQVGASFVTPLTSLFQTLLEGGADYASANATLASRLGLPANSDLTSLNPIQGSSEILGQNAAVMTAAVQFSELAARHLVTDEAHASWTVFSAISHVLSELPDGQVADFTSDSLLSAIADQLKLDHLASSDIIEFMAASQLALQRSLDTLPADADALAAISAVQHLVQGTYAQVLGSVANGDLAVQALDDLTHTLTAFGHGDLSLDQLDSFDQQLTLAGNDGQITESEFAQAASRLPDLAEDGAFAVAPVDALVADTPVPAVDIFIQDLAITDEQVVESEVASLDDLVEQYVGENALTDEAMAEYQQELALTEVSVTADMAADPAAIEPTADALAALEEVHALLSDDASDGIATVADVVDDFSYTV